MDNYLNASIEKMSNARSGLHPRNGGCFPLFQWLIGCCSPLVVDVNDLDEKQQSGTKLVDPTERNHNLSIDDDQFLPQDTELIQVAHYSHEHSSAIHPVRVSTTEHGLQTAVSIEPNCVTHDWKSNRITDQLLSAFSEKGYSRDGQHREHFTQDWQGPVDVLNSGQDTTSVQNIFISQKRSTKFQDEEQMGNKLRKSPMSSEINGTSCSGENINDEASEENLHAKIGTRQRDNLIVDSPTMNRMLEQKQYLRNELWHVSAALQYPGSGVGSSSGYQVEKDDKYQSILCDSTNALGERQRFFSERRALLNLLDQEIHDFVVQL